MTSEHTTEFSPPPLPAVIKGKKLLFAAVAIFVAFMFVPLVAIFSPQSQPTDAAVGSADFMDQQVHVSSHLLLDHNLLSASRVTTGSVPGWEWVSFLIFPPMIWQMLKGSNLYRYLLGIMAVLGAMASSGVAFALLSGDLKDVTFVGLLSFLLACFLVNVFMINKSVQAYVISVRKQRGLSADHWKIGP